MTELAGIVIRGKYTFEISDELVIRLLLLSEIAVAKNCHGSMPQNTRIG